MIDVNIYNLNKGIGDKNGIIKKQRKSGKAYAIPEDDAPPCLPNKQDFIILRLSMGILGKAQCKNGVPKKMKERIVPQFLMVATDREVAVAEVNRMINELFDAWEKNKK